jgi:hypothetical protein
MVPPNRNILAKWPPLNLSSKDHEGGGWVQITQVRVGKWVPVTDWMRAYTDVVNRHVATGG